MSTRFQTIWFAWSEPGLHCVACVKHLNELQMEFVEPPHPKWTPGTPQKLPFPGTYISLDPSALGSSATYPLVISAVVPRPIGFLGTLSKAGAVNLAPYSYCGAMGHDPPLVSDLIFCKLWAIFLSP